MGFVIVIYSSILVRLVAVKRQAALSQSLLSTTTNEITVGAFRGHASRPNDVNSMLMSWREEIDTEGAVVKSWYEQEVRTLKDFRTARRTERLRFLHVNHSASASTDTGDVNVDWTDLRQKPATAFAPPTQRPSSAVPSEVADADADSNTMPLPFVSDGEHGHEHGHPSPNDAARWCRVYGVERELNATAKVLITGIVSSPVGVHLALYLSTHCQVSTIIGVDHLLPNTMLHRLKLLSGPLNMLSRTIPKFTLDVPLMGLDPPPRTKTSSTDNYNDNNNWMDRHAPTHVVHLQPLNAERIFPRTSAGGPKEPRVTDVHPTPLDSYLQEADDHDNGPTHDATPTWWSVYGSHRPLHALKQLRVAMDDIFGTVLEAYTKNEARQRDMMRDLQASNQLQNDLERMGVPARGASAKGGDDLASAQPSGATAVPDLRLPHIVYASSRDVSHASPDADTRPMDLVARSIALTNERIATAYASSSSSNTSTSSSKSRVPIPSVGVRFGTVYGPHDHFMSPTYQMAERFWTNPTSNPAGSTMSAGMDAVEDFAALKDWVYVDDAVQAVLMAMQLDLTTANTKGEREGEGSDVVYHRTMDMNVTSGSQRRSVRDLVTIAKDLAAELNTNANGNDNVVDEYDSSAIHKAETETFSYASGWAPTTTLKQGVKKLLAWHYEQTHPFPPMIMDATTSKDSDKDKEKHQMGKQLLQSPDAGIAHCTSNNNNAYCHLGSILTHLPCASECSFSQYPGMCAPSIWDSVKEVIHTATEDCQYVLYTIALGREVTVMPHKLSASDERFDGTTVCNIAIIPQESELAMNIIRRIPGNNDDGTTDPTQALTEAQATARFKEFNGVVEADGWTAVWIPPLEHFDAETGTVTTMTLMDSTPLTNADLMMLKMTPGGGFFDASVQYAMYVDENFNVSPTQDDVEFLISEVDRSARPARTVTYRPPRPSKSDETEDTPPAPIPPASTIKFKLPREQAKKAVLLLSPIRTPPNTKKLTTNSATKLMLHELGLSMDASGPLKKQRTWYETISSKVNKDSLRSMYEPLYKYSQAPFYTRSKWLIHDLWSEEARQLRCEWYHEHILWNNELDALSISAVLARRDIERRMKWQEVDEREKLKRVQIPQSITDENDWAQLYHANAKKKKSNLFVRIMTDSEMLSSRKKWVTKKKKQ
jgi:nucleoside-diphosphate-sugar epimerase